MDDIQKEALKRRKLRIMEMMAAHPEVEVPSISKDVTTPLFSEEELADLSPEEKKKYKLK